ncbi:hypothetical protein [Aquabacterium sp. OR-4]|uniref:hypothetical protein n=1 Tax=Aquabacterium sp. OR-4 TaxID=2978127 RepID=UPI0021B2C4EB|nr:hypothetical protein [Aquabacterium sp. OR-4]MDT7834949.1 hypothetical protein [Aquabacterium sp. OR-4]
MMRMVGPALRAGIDPYWRHVVLLLQGGSGVDQSSAQTSVQLLPSGLYQPGGSTEHLDGTLPTIKVINPVSYAPGIVCDIPALGSQDWTFELYAHYTGPYFALWTDAKDRSGGDPYGGFTAWVSNAGDRRMDVMLNNNTATVKNGATPDAQPAFPWGAYYCVERKGRYVYLSTGGVIRGTIDLGSTGYTLNARERVPRIGDWSTDAGSGWVQYVGRVRWTLGVARYDGLGFTPPVGLLPVG